MGILEATHVCCEAEVVPRYIRPLPTLVGEGLFYFRNAWCRLGICADTCSLSAQVEPDIPMSLRSHLHGSKVAEKKQVYAQNA